MRVTFLLRYPVAAVMCDVLRATNRQKVQRVILATFRVRDSTSSTPARLSCQCPRTYCSLTAYYLLLSVYAHMLLFIFMYRSLVKECPPSKECPPPTCTVYRIVGNFRRYKFFTKQVKIRVSEIFVVLIFAVNKSGTHGLASGMA